MDDLVAASATAVEMTGLTPVLRWKQSLRALLLAGGATLLLVSAGLWCWPAAAGWLANSLAPSVERQLGDGLLAVLDGSNFRPSTLPLARQQELAAEFGRLLPPRPGAPAWRLLFRQSRSGPQALALPSGDIVLTDDMVALLQDDAAVMGVLAHELGHLQQRHLSRRLIQRAPLAASSGLLLGDAASMLSYMPALAQDLNYARGAERDADDYAIAMLNQNGIALRHLAEALAKLRQWELRSQPDGAPDSAGSYLSIHPGSAERIARIRAAQP